MINEGDKTPDEKKVDSSCSHILIMIHPLSRNNVRFFLSLFFVVSIFLIQKKVLDFGIRQCRGQPCQKHPSTNTAFLLLGKTKSGFPSKGYRRRQPVTCIIRKNAATATSVDLLSDERIFAIIRDRSDDETVSIVYDIISIHESSNLIDSSTSSRSSIGGFLIRIERRFSGTSSIIVNCEPWGCQVKTC